MPEFLIQEYSCIKNFVYGNIPVLKIRGLYGLSLVSLASLAPSSAHHETKQAHELALDGPGWAQDHHLDGPGWSKMP